MWGRIFKSEKFLTDTFVFALSSGGGNFVIYTGSSNDGLECILIIHDKVIVYAFES